jgi:hypothetical protein
MKVVSAKDKQLVDSQIDDFTASYIYELADKSYKALPELLKLDYGITVTSSLIRQFVNDKQGKDIQVNIIGQAERNGKKIMIIGDVKSQLSKNDTDEFIIKKINRLKSVYEEIFPIMIIHKTTGPDVEAYVKSKGIALYYSYDFV